MPSEADLDLALTLADTADEISMRRFRANDLAISTKPDMTPVTDADRAVESALREVLAAGRPSDGILGEEFGSQDPANATESEPPKESEVRTWVIDPIDGTKNYVRGVPVWASLIGLMVDSQVEVAVVSAPALGRRWWARRGGGAWMTEPGSGPRRCRVSAVSSLDAASLSYASLGGWHTLGRQQEFLDLLGSAWRSRAYGDFWSYMLVAEGAVDACAEPELALHDMVAPSLVVTEAGGNFTSLAGVPGPHGGNAIASNGLLHDELLRRLG